jgi:hypothetical protein
MSVGVRNSSGVGAPLGNDNAVGNPGGGAPLGNSNAVGNDGGGAPEGNKNRKSHGVYCDLEKIDERAEGEMAEFIDRMERLVRERATGDPGEMAREIPLRLIRFNRASREVRDNGFVVDGGQVNPMVPKSRRILDGVFDDLHELGAI